MPALRAAIEFDHLPRLLRGEPEAADAGLERWDTTRGIVYLLVIIVGAGCYGAVMGYWRGIEQAIYTAAKFPLVIVLTTVGNALLNGMLAPLLGSTFTLRQSFQAVVMSFTIASIVLAGLSPIVCFVSWNLPGAETGLASETSYRFMQLIHVSVIAAAGIIANANLLPLLRRWSRSASAAYRVLFAWLLGNLFLGSQICWILRPFIGKPNQEVQFLGSDPFQGSLYETIFDSIRHLLNH